MQYSFGNKCPAGNYFSIEIFKIVSCIFKNLLVRVNLYIASEANVCEMGYQGKAVEMVCQCV